MKKLSLLLLTLCVSLAGWTNESDPYRLNPFAYDLSSSWDEASQKLTLRFKVNSVPNLEDKNGWSCGIQVFAVDSRETKYYIWGIPGNTIREAHNGGAGTYEYVADLSSGRDLHGNLIPRNEDLTWMVRVAGRGDGNSTPVTPGNGEAAIDYTLPRFWNFQNSFSDKRYISPSIAVSTNPNAPNFGDIFIIDNMNPDSHTSTKWSAVSTGRGIYVYKPDFKTKAYSGNKVAIDPTTKPGGFKDTSEPRDLCVSKDGRVFVCSYSTASTVAVWELKNNYTTWTPILNKEDITKKVTGGTSNKHSVVSIDVKGEGDNVTLLLLCKGSVNNNNHSNFPLLKCVEYNVSTETLTEIQLPQRIYDFVYYNEGINAHARIAYDDTNNWIWCGFGTGSGENGGASYVRAFDPTIANDNNVNKNLKVNETIGNFWGGEAFCVKGNMLIKSIQSKTYDRPSIIFRTIDRSKTDVTAVITDNPCFTYYGDVNNVILNADFATDCYNDFALDYANNLYVANNWSGQVFPISLPYDGIKDTPAPSNQKFRLPLAVPNILATDLRCEPHATQNKYIFSFNTNTKPEVAQIRFYENEADMLACNNNYAFYYQFPDGDCKQGSMSVIFDAVGGKINGDKTLQDMKLPAGLYYWNVYVKTRESYIFAPIYTQPAVGASDFHRQHATVDNNPDNEGFGHIYVADHHNIENSNNRIHYVRAYTIGNATNAGREDNQSNINDNTRYTTHWQVKTNNKVHYTRRPTVSPDGLLFVADEGSNQKSAQPNWFKDASLVTYGFSGAGLHIMDPQKQTNNANAVWEDNFSVPNATTGNQEVTTGAYFLKKDGVWKLYRTNTYEEFTLHPEKDGADYNYRNARWNTNGYRVYNLTSNASGLVHSGYADNSTTEVPFGAGDAGGQFSIVATEYGVWMCQHRENTVANAPSLNGKPQLPDNEENIILSFFDHNGARKFTSYTYDSGNLTQTTSSVLQSTPGAGMAYQKRDGVEYLYIVNHAGNILEFKITGGATPNLTHTRTYTTGNSTKGSKYKAISSMNFDYAGNLVVTAGEFYGVTGENRDHQELVVYTMPYPNKENARSIPAPKSCRKIPERVAQLGMDNRELGLLIDGHQKKYPGGCAVDIYRPLQGDMFNTICLPFTLNLTSLPEDHPLKGATVREYYGLKLENIGGEDVLELQFKDVTEIVANIPYIIQPRQKEGINHIVRLDGPIQLQDVDEQSVTRTEETTNTYSIIYKGVIPFQYVEPEKDPNTGEILTLMLVADNRLALMTSAGNMLGFRGYFNLTKPLQGIKARITNSKGTTTNTTIVVDGKKVNVEKFLQEGRVYIRVGDSLYTIDGQKVE